MKNREPAIDTQKSSIVNRDLRIFDDLEHLSWAAAARFAELARIKAIEKKIFTAALSGGSTPKLLYEILGSPAFTGRVRWPNVHLFQVDERCVLPDDPDSNYRLIHQAMLESSPLPEENFHRMAAERPDHERAARDYADDLARVLQPAPGEFPRLELVFLGMGPDGHTASLFPGSAALDEQTAWVVPNYVEKLKAFRLTLTLPVLNAAAFVIFMVTGADKAVTLCEVLEGPPERFPAQRIQPARGSVSWFVDKGAAQLLSPAAKG
ncbi:MAG: 6-phosphogluconolactonase [Terriglobia bacterium]|jgi:6-phosphogluconolactonase